MTEPDSGPGINLVEADLALPSKLALQMFRRLAPGLLPHLRMVPLGEHPGMHLQANIPAPHIEGLELYLWMDEATDLSVGLGNWHTHSGCIPGGAPPTEGYPEIIEICTDYLKNQILIRREFTEAPLGPNDTPLSLRDAESVLDEITSPYGDSELLVGAWGWGKFLEMPHDAFQQTQEGTIRIDFALPFDAQVLNVGPDNVSSNRE